MTVQPGRLTATGFLKTRRLQYESEGGICAPSSGTAPGTRCCGGYPLGLSPQAPPSTIFSTRLAVGEDDGHNMHQIEADRLFLRISIFLTSGVGHEQGNWLSVPSEQKGTKKQAVDVIHLKEVGHRGRRHAGKWHRQVSCSPG